MYTSILRQRDSGFLKGPYGMKIIFYNYSSENKSIHI